MLKLIHVYVKNVLRTFNFINNKIFFIFSLVEDLIENFLTFFFVFIKKNNDESINHLKKKNYQ